MSLIYRKVTTAILLIGSLSACSMLPIKVDIDSGHFRFENYKDDRGAKQEFVSLMCHRKKVHGWELAKQYPAGEHELWVRANIGKTGVKNSNKEAVVHFNVNLKAGNNYALKKADSGQSEISIWIEDLNSKERVSEIKKAKWEYKPIRNYREKKKMCRAGSI